MNQFSEIMASLAAVRQLLIVDDETPVREVLKEYFSKSGYHVVTASTGAEALRIASDLRLDAIAIDLVLGDIDGLELLDHLVGSQPERPVIVMTGFGSDEQLAERAQERGAAAFVSKTSPLSELKAAIDGVVASRKPAASPERPKTQPHKSAGALSGAIPPEILCCIRQTSEPSPGQPPHDIIGEPDHTSPAGLSSRHRFETRELSSAEQGAEPSDSSGGTGLSESPPSTPEREAILLDPKTAGASCTLGTENSKVSTAIEIFLRMLDAFDRNLGNTSMRAAVLCKTLGAVANLARQDHENLVWAAALHDIGMVPMDHSLIRRWLRNPQNCSKSELAVIRKHPAHAKEILESIPEFRGASEVILAHHEQWDGGGFPEGTRMEAIPWLARLLAPAVYYCSQHHPSDKTLVEIAAKRDLLFDPAAVEALDAAIRVAPPTRGKRQIRTSDLRTGAVLAEGVLDMEGVVLIGQETKLELPHLIRLSRLAEFGQIDPEVLVYA